MLEIAWGLLQGNLWFPGFCTNVFKYSICDFNLSFLSTIIPRIFFSLTCFIVQPFTVISILEIVLFLFSNRMTCVFCPFIFIHHFWHHRIIIFRSHWSSSPSCFMLLLLCHRLWLPAFLDSLSGYLNGELGSCRFDLAGSAERSPVNTRDSTGLSMDPEKVWNHF